MGNLYLGNQKSALNKAFIEIMQKLSVFPSKALTASDVSFYQGSTSLREWLNTPTSEVDYMVYDANTLNLLDKNEETYTRYWKIIWKFPEPVSAKTLKMNMLGNWDGKFYATNDSTACFNAWESWTYSEELGEVLLEDSSIREWGDMPLNPSQKYQYFFLSSPFNGGPDYFKEVELELGENDKPSDELLKVFPSEPITADSENYFVRNLGEDGQFKAYEGDVAYLGLYQDSYRIIDKDETVASGNTKMWFKFKEPVKIKSVSINIDTQDRWSLVGIPTQSDLEWSIRNNLSAGYPVIVTSSGSTDGVMIDYPSNEETAYQYYMFNSSYSGSIIYEIALKTE